MGWIGDPRAVLIRRFRNTLLLPVVIIVLGTYGYTVIEHWPFFDSLYMTVMTVTTVGFGEVHPLSEGGRWFTIVLMLGGIFTLFYAAGAIIRSIVSGEVQAAYGSQRMERSLAEMRDHLIVCGFGRMGRLVCKDFSAERTPFVVIERNAELLADFPHELGVALHGDATSDDVLRKVGIERARALVTLAGSDADNLYITMSARLMSERLFIVARAEDERAEQKLLRAGANRVISPYTIGGSRVAQAVLRPTVVDFIELATRTEHLEIQIEETRIAPTSSLAGKQLRESHLREHYGVIIVAIKNVAGRMVFNPPGETVLAANDILIVLGSREQLDHLDKLAQG